jgi:hypothetical protein
MVHGFFAATKMFRFVTMFLERTTEMLIFAILSDRLTLSTDPYPADAERVDCEISPIQVFVDKLIGVNNTALESDIHTVETTCSAVQVTDGDFSQRENQFW